MPKTFSDEHKAIVVRLSSEGMSNNAIAKYMLGLYPDDWNSKYVNRSIARILKEAANSDSLNVTTPKTLDEMTREERYKFIESRLGQTPRFKMTFKHFDDDDKQVFVEEYLSIVKSTETLTEAEEQALFAAILELVLALKSLGRKEHEEHLRDQSLEGKIPETDPKFRRVVDDKYQREYDQHMKLYQKAMNELKMSRAQRLKEVRSQKQSLVDLAESLSSKNAQAEAADEISRLSRLKDDELKRLLDEGYLHGIFEDF